MCNDLWVLHFNGESDSKRKQMAKIVDHFLIIKFFYCCYVVQRDCEIMMTLDLDSLHMLCSREEFSFKNVYVSMLVGTKHLYTQKWFTKLRLEMPFLDGNIKSKDKRQNFKISKPISLSVFISFQHLIVFSLFWWLNNRVIMILAPAHDQKYPLCRWS